MRRRALIGALGGLLAVSAVPQAAHASDSAVPPPPSHYGQLGPPVPVNLAAVPARGGSPAAQLPRLHRSQATYDAQKQQVAQGSAARSGGVVTLGHLAPSPQVTNQAAPGLLSGITGISLQQQVALFGSDQNHAPPDTQLAVGPSNVAEATNDTLAIWNKQGTLVKTGDLNVFFPTPSGQLFTDPRLLFDEDSGRWFLSGLTFNPTTADSTVFLGVSLTSDATGGWNAYQVASRKAILADQPATGVNTDKVVISWNDYSSVSSSATFLGGETLVLQKSDLQAGAATVHSWAKGPDLNAFRIVPAQSLSSTTTEWLAYDNADCVLSCSTPNPAIGIIRVTGTPLANNVAWNETDPTISPTTTPPDPRQPSGVPVDQAIDDRFNSAVWQNGILWTSGNDACVPAGDTTMSSCMRLISVSTATSVPSVTVDIDAAIKGTDLYYPAVVVNDLGDLFIAYSESSPSLFPSALATYSLAAAPTTFYGPILLAAGQNSYRSSPFQRWGDYSASARDPSDKSDVWLAAEYQASSTDQTNWGTSMGRIAVQPSIATVTPSLGLLAGGQTVTLNGDHFQQGATVNFGSNPATNVTVVSSNQIKATTPAATTAATVDVTITQPDGTTTTATAAYTYSTALGTAYTAISPARLLDTRLTNGTLGPLKSLTLTVTGGAAAVPASAQTVVLNVTVTNTTAPSFLAVYPTGYPQPLASNLNWVAGKTIPNLVAVPVGSAGRVTFYNAAGSVDVVVDLEGYFAPVNGSAGQFQPLPPKRILDTRTPPNASRLGAAQTLNLQVTGQGGVPTSGVSAVVMNVTATNPTAQSYLTLWPAGTTMQTASNLNFAAGQTVANRVIVPVGKTGQVSVFNGAGSTDVVADVNGYFTDSTASGGQLMFPLSPVRIKDTRTTGQTLGPAASINVAIAGANSVPANATAAVLNVTATNTTAPSYFTVFPGTGTPPLASDLNWIAGSTVPNLVIVKLGAGGASIYNGAGSADAVVDAFGYFVPSPGIAVIAQPSSIPAMATSKSTITATVTLADGTAPSGDAVTFTTAGGASCGTISGTPANTDPTGTATATYTASTTPGTCTITVNDASKGMTGSINITQT